MKTILLLLFAFSFTSTYSQTSSWIWAKNLPYNKTNSQNQDFINSCVDNENNVYMLTRLRGTVVYPNGTFVGTTSGGTSNGTFILSKTDVNGNVLWGMKIENIGDFKMSNGTYNMDDYMEINSIGDIFLAYTTVAKTVIQGGIGLQTDSVKLMRISKNGILLSNKPLITSNKPRYNYIQGIKLIDDSHIVVTGGPGTGQFMSFSGGTNYYLGNLLIQPAATGNNAEAFIGIIDTAGVAVMAKFLHVIMPYDDKLMQYDIDTDINGNIYVAGSFTPGKVAGTLAIEGYSVTVTNQYHKFIYKMNQAGTVQWVKVFSSPDRYMSSSLSYYISELETDKTGNFLYVGGNHAYEITENGTSVLPASNPVSIDGFLLKLNTSDGSLVWAKSISTTGTSNENFVYKVKVNNNNNPVTLSKKTSQDAVTIHSALDGSDINAIYRGYSSGYIPKLAVTTDNNYYLTTDFTKSTFFGGIFLGSNTNPNIIVPAIAYISLSDGTTTNVSNASNLKFSTYPNPTNDFILLNGVNGNDKLFARISTIDGKVAQNENVFDNKIDVSKLPTGIYFLELKNSEGYIGTTKFIKE